MTIRASGGRIVVTVTKSRPASAARRFILESQGFWEWSIPEPKGHPQPPSWQTLSGRAHTQGEALTAGFARLCEVYGMVMPPALCSGPGLFPGAAGCARCDEIRRAQLVAETGDWTQGFRVMIVCVDCGNKRCPKASDHRNACTGSNEPGQAGSDYGHPCMCGVRTPLDGVLGLLARRDPDCLFTGHEAFAALLDGKPSSV